MNDRLNKLLSEYKKEKKQDVSFVDSALGAAVEIAYAELVTKVPVLKEGYLLTRIFSDDIKRKKQGYDKVKELFSLGIASKDDYETAVTGSQICYALSVPDKMVKATKDYLGSACADAGINDATVLKYIEDNHPQIANLAHRFMQLMPEQILKRYEYVLDDANAKFFDPTAMDYFPPEYSTSFKEQRVLRVAPSLSSNSSDASSITSRNDHQFFDGMVAKVVKKIQTEFSASSDLIKQQDKVRAYENLKNDFRELGYIAGDIAASFGNPRLGRQIKTSIVGTVTICDKLAQLGSFGTEIASLTVSSTALTSMGAAGAGLSAAMPYVAIVGAVWSIMSSFLADDSNDGLSEALEAIMESLSVINSNVIAVHKAVETLRQECYEYHVEEMHALIKIYNQNKIAGRRFNEFRNELRAKFIEIEKRNSITHQKLDSLTSISIGYFQEIKATLRNFRINDLEMFLEEVEHAISDCRDSKTMHLLLQRLRDYAVRFATETSMNGGAISLNSRETVISTLKEEKSHVHSLGFLLIYFRNYSSMNAIAHPAIILLIVDALANLLRFQIKNKKPIVHKDRNLEYIFEIRRELVKIREFRKQLTHSKAYRNLISDCITELNNIKKKTQQDRERFQKSLHDARAQVIKDSFKKDKEKVLARTSYPRPNYMDTIQNAYNIVNAGAEYGYGVLIRLNFEPNSFSYTSGGTVVPGWSSEVSELAQGNFSAITSNQKSCYDEYLKDLFGSHYDDLRTKLINSSVFNIFSAPNIGNGAFGLSRTIDITYRNTTVTVGCANFIPIEARCLIAENYGLGKIIYKGEIFQNKLVIRTYFKINATDQQLLIGHFEKDFTPSIDSNDEFVIMQCWYGGRDIKSTSELINMNGFNGKGSHKGSRDECSFIYPKATTYPRLASNGGYASVAIPNIAATQQFIDRLNQEFLVNKRKEFSVSLVLDTNLLEEKFYILRTLLQFIYGLFNDTTFECLMPFIGFDPSFKNIRLHYAGGLNFIDEYAEQFIIRLKNLENYLEYHHPMPDILDRHIDTLDGLIHHYSTTISEYEKNEVPDQKDVIDLVMQQNALLAEKLTEEQTDMKKIQVQLQNLSDENAKIKSELSNMSRILNDLMSIMPSILQSSITQDLSDSKNKSSNISQAGIFKPC